MLTSMQADIRGTLDEIRASGLYKAEREITSAQQVRIDVAGRGTVLNLCANNYLGLANHPVVIRAAHEALDRWGFGAASVRFICGTQSVHRELERRLSGFLGTDDTILYSSCFDANGGVFETLLGSEDAVISDELNHASIIDGIRLSKAQRFRYRNGDMDDLEGMLKQTTHARRRLIVTDGVFSMDGHIAKLDTLCALADRYDAMVMVDDSHAVGFVGAHGRGTHELHGVMDRVDLLSGTLGKALGGASGGYVSGRRDLIELLRQRSRPYLFSNSLAPPIAAVTLAVLDLVEEGAALRERLWRNTSWFREHIQAAGFDIVPGTHPIVPIMVGDAHLAARMAEQLLALGVYVMPFSYPVVPQGRARIRVQLSAAHTLDDLAFAIQQFELVNRLRPQERS